MNAGWKKEKHEGVSEDGKSKYCTPGQKPCTGIQHVYKLGKIKILRKKQKKIV